MRALFLVGILCTVLGAGKTVLAEGTLREAKAHFHAGEVAYKLGQFDEALNEFSRAYEARPIAAFLFNIGQCHRELKHYERAIFFYEGYLRELPGAANRKLVEELLKDAHQKQDALAASERQAASRSAQPMPPRAIEPASTPVIITQQPAPTPVYKKAWFWGTAAGVVVAGVGAGLAIYFLDTKRVPPTGSLGTLNRQ